MAKISLIRQCLTHLVVAMIAFQLGSMTTSSKCLQQLPAISSSFGNSAARSQDWDLQRNRRWIRKNNNEDSGESLGHNVSAKRRKEQSGNGAISKEASIDIGERIPTSSSSSETNNTNTPVKDFIHGMAWIPRNEFVKNFDVGVAIDNAGAKNINNTVLLVYADKKALPKGSQTQNNGINTMSNSFLATENCDDLSIVISSSKRKKRCIAIMENWGGSPHLFRFLRSGDGPEPRPLRLGGRFEGGAAWWQKPPPRPMTHKSWKQLADFLYHYDDTWNALKPIAAKVAIAGGRGGGQQATQADPKQKASKGAITVMVSSFGQAQLLLNFVCASKSVGYNLSNVLLFAMDQKTYDLAQQLDLATFYPKHLFDGYVPKNQVENQNFGDSRFATIMMGKVYSVQLVNDLGYDVLFQDLDVIPLRTDVMEYFYSVRKDAADVDMFFQYDRNHNSEQAPYSANSGFYFVKHNAKTVYFFSMLARMGDLVLKTGSHQQTMSILMGEHMATHGLKVKVMGGEEEDAHLFPNGWHYHKSKNEYMKELKEGKQTPYVFHMNWNNNGKEKQDVMKEAGYWFVEDSCHVSNLTSAFKGCCKRTEIVTVT